ncbi:hypothetical protein CHGG_00341 [Chaetomium globosum CBS 148.51]|uniref:Rhodopsin domain-containing protein n=1 Tax=Chaetomium globosum (strain ATCC 6205 / CBS 148.51 / DSM 1962 / NBRC 6347 / NRRL 1970) TaxID=306901 RepID=Q2HHG3_CHAGB|nr:uncharacterized protein CHGG_00341 [Chaetomium globosum CBS 148.51]EAQ92106.1 hypothetical protein CHGG_00341 [Chaetomium globosum CBS 148.51]
MSSGNFTFHIDPVRAAESNATVFTAVVCVFWGLAFVTAVVRFYTRAVLSRSFGKDDVFMVLAVLCGIGGLASWIVACKNGYGRHIDTIYPKEFLTLLEAQFYQSVVEASFAFGFLKISIALSLLRLSRGSWYNRILWILIGFTCFYTLFSFITFLTYCNPIAGQWNPSLRPKCYSRVIYRNFGLFNAGQSFPRFTKPCSILLKLLVFSMQHRNRHFLCHAADTPDMEFAAPETARAMFIIAIQLDIGIIAACAPTLRPLLGRALRLSTTLDPYRGANYYRAGKALDRLPITGNPARRYLRQTTFSGQFEMTRGQKQWAAATHKDSGFSTTAIHAEHVEIKGEASGESIEDAISPLSDPEFKGIIKTTEVKVEK